MNYAKNEDAESFNHCGLAHNRIYSAFFWWNFKINLSAFKIPQVAIHIALLAVWATSIHHRIIHKHVRRSMMNIAVLMIFWISIKALKYHVIPDIAVCSVYFGIFTMYLFYIFRLSGFWSHLLSARVKDIAFRDGRAF